MQSENSPNSTPKVASKPPRKLTKPSSQTIQFKRYILSLCKKIHLGELQLSKELLNVLQDFLMDVLLKVRICLLSLSQKKASKTLKARDIETVVKLCLPKLLKELAHVNGRYALMYRNIRVK